MALLCGWSIATFMFPSIPPHLSNGALPMSNLTRPMPGTASDKTLTKLLQNFDTTSTKLWHQTKTSTKLWQPHQSWNQTPSTMQQTKHETTNIINNKQIIAHLMKHQTSCINQCIIGQAPSTSTKHQTKQERPNVNNQELIMDQASSKKLQIYKAMPIPPSSYTWQLKPHHKTYCPQKTTSN